jgi:hypothetical protein
MAFTGKRWFANWADFGDFQVAVVQGEVALRWYSLSLRPVKIFTLPHMEFMIPSNVES